MRIVADRDVCIGSGNCVLSAPEVFDQDDQVGLVVLLAAEVGPQDADAVRQAIARCPSGALGLVDDEPAGDEGATAAR